MGAARKKRATYEDLLAVPDIQVAEIIDGDLITSPRPAVRHARATSRLSTFLGDPFDRGRGGPGGWVILYEPELHFGDDVLVPDLAGWRRERLPALPDAAAMTLAPDWACEVLSPSTERIDRARKMPVYAREGVANIWLINPAARTLEAYRLGDGIWTLRGTFCDSAQARIEPFDAVELPLADLWAD